ncbi:MAG: general secretion pathway protein GspB [Pseudomonadales bacterium]
MSYILDALNKSEQDRKNEGSPRIDTVHRRLDTSPGSTRSWLIPLTVIAVLNAGFIAFWMMRDTASPPVKSILTVADQPGQQLSTTGTGPASAAIQTVKGRTPPLLDTGAIDADEALLITPKDFYSQRGTRPVTEPALALAVPRISELPTSIQRQIPDLAFSSHIFADEASFRMVNINGRLLREGDRLDDQTRLVEITEQGVIFTHQQYTFEVSVLRDWSFN